jgi:RNA polymerase sigma-70 factor (ECF subfamily)
MVALIFSATNREPPATKLKEMLPIDEADVAEVLAGDVDRFEQIVRRYEKPLLHYALRFTRSRSEAEEMAHDALVSCYRSLPSWRGESVFSTWLFAIALNVFRSAMRRRQPEGLTIDDDLLVDERSEERASERQEADLVRRAVAHLPAKYRDALATFYFKEEDLAETAKILGRAPGTVKALLHRGRKLLATRLGPILKRRTE